MSFFIQRHHSGTKNAFKGETTVRTEAKIDLAQETRQYAVKSIGVLSALIGAWEMACLIGDLSKSGAVGMFQGYVSALTGM